jgi:hypothetical protein
MQLPKALTLARLEHQGSQVLVVALRRRSQNHSVFLADLLKLHAPKCVVTPLACDHPWFILAEKTDLVTAWSTFMKTSRGQFLIRPRPEVFQDVLLTREKAADFHSSTFLNSLDHFEASPHVAYSQHIQLRERSGTGGKSPLMQVDALLTPLLWLHNNRETANVAVISGMPELVLRDQVVRSMTVHDMREHFEKFLQVHWEDYGEFSLQQHLGELFLRPKAQYTTELLRLACMSFPDVLAVVEAELLPFLLEEWRKMPATLRPLPDFFQIKPFASPTPFVDHVEMHALMDLMLPPFLSEWYLPYHIYPYSAFGTLGTEEAFYGQALTTWQYYYDQHMTAYREAWMQSPGGRNVKKPKSKA